MTVYHDPLSLGIFMRGPLYAVVFNRWVCKACHRPPHIPHPERVKLIVFVHSAEVFFCLFSDCTGPLHVSGGGCESVEDIRSGDLHWAGQYLVCLRAESATLWGPRILLVCPRPMVASGLQLLSLSLCTATTKGTLGLQSFACVPQSKWGLYLLVTSNTNLKSCSVTLGERMVVDI